MDDDRESDESSGELEKKPWVNT